MTSLLIRLRFLLPVLVLLAGCVSIEERRERVFSQVQTALDAGEADRALAILRSALNYDPRDAALRLRLAEVQLELGQAYAARGTLESLPGDVSKTPEHGRLLAHALVDSGQTWQALPLVIALERKEEVDPDLVHRLLEQLSRHDVVNAEIPVPWRRRLVRRKLIAGNSSAALLSWRRLPRDDPRREEYFEKILEQALTQNDGSLLQDLPELRKATPSPWTLLARHRLALADGVAGEIAALEDEFLDRFPQHAHRYPILLGKARRSIRRGQYHEGLHLAR